GRVDRVDEAISARRPAEPASPTFDFSAAGSPSLLEKELVRFDQAKTAYEQALAAWKADHARIKVECGSPEAYAAVDVAAEAVCVFCERIAGIRAKTVDGLIFKARYAASHTDAELLALATDCEAAERRADETGDALIEAEEKRGAIDIPPALFRTARD